MFRPSRVAHGIGDGDRRPPHASYFADRPIGTGPFPLGSSTGAFAILSWTAGAGSRRP